MTLGRTSSGSIKIKTDGGLRAVECACCGGCQQIPAGTQVTISAFGKSSTFVMALDSNGQTTSGDSGFVSSDIVNQNWVERYIQGVDCVSDFVIGATYEDVTETFSWRFSIIGCTCYLYYVEKENISDVYINIFQGIVCRCPYFSTETINKITDFDFQINGKGTYTFDMPESIITSHLLPADSDGNCPENSTTTITRSVTVVIS